MADETTKVESASPEPASSPEASHAEPRGTETETAGVSTDTTGASDQPASEEAAKPERKSFDDLLQDPEINAEYQRKLARDLKKREERAEQKRLREEATAARGDPDRALNFAEKFSSMPDFADDADFTPQERAARNVTLLSTDAEGGMRWLTQEREYEFLYKHHKAELDQQITKLGPTEFARWVLDQGLEREIDARADEKAKKQSLDMAKAIATDETAKALRDVPQVLNGNAGGGSLSDNDIVRLYGEGSTRITREQYEKAKAGRA
ncbi:MAG: hypothetical protein NUW01_14225 [Gemmatimonadaceae bacterium]|nr:hypothetical protein [Gemmatimonadaceae bacterium]